VILGALAQAVPEKVIAACMGSNAWVGFSGVDPRGNTFYTYPETIGGGFGARAEKDGMDGVQCHLTNTSNLPIESLEQEYPLIVERYELVPDSGGPGRWRGGLGIRRDIRLLRGTAVLEGSTSRRLTDPWGLRGGLAGSRATVTVNGNAALVDPPGRAIVAPGDAVSIVTAGGGGYGDPQERDRPLVEADLIDGKITERQAREAYAPPQPRVGSPAP
jgi:N-methylhydantoinase B